MVYRVCIIVGLLSLVSASMPGTVHASPPANTCPGSCNVCGADGVTCHSRWWQDLDTYLVETFPVQVNRTSTGKLVYVQCQFIPGTRTPTQWCGGVLPVKITLREWCRRLMVLPVPPRVRATDEGDLYVLFSSGGVCP